MPAWLVKLGKWVLPILLEWTYGKVMKWWRGQEEKKKRKAAKKKRDTHFDETAKLVGEAKTDKEVSDALKRLRDDWNSNR